MVSTIRIAMAQINPTVGDLQANRTKIIDYIGRAKNLEADIILFPELAVCGYPPEDLLLKKHFINDNIKSLRSIQKETSDIIAVVGFVDTDKRGNIYNAAAVLHKGKLIRVYHKIKLPNYGVFDEKRYFTPGTRNYVFDISPLCFGVSICEDIWESNGVYKAQVDGGAHLLINISASPFHAGKKNVRKQVLKRRVQETHACICYLNLVGGQDELVFDGGSIILDRQGDIIASGKHFEEDLICADINTKFLVSHTKSSLKNVFLIKLPFKEKKKKKKCLSHIIKPLKSIEEMYKALVLGTQDYVKKNGFEKVVIGLSGGIDSTLTVVIACDALGKENVIGISMPSQYTSQGTKDDAQRVARSLGIRFIEVPIHTIYEKYLDVMSHEFQGLGFDVTEENLQARIRSNILMAFSNKFSWLVLTTGNKSETAVGYCTLYGDMAGGFSVIKDVSKTHVYKLARYRNTLEGKELIPKSVICRAPSAELRENQKDQDTLPPYAILDPILKEYIEEDRSFEEIVLQNDRASIVRDVITMVDRNEYKRRQSPPGIKITPKAFGRDRRLPITNRYKAV